MSKVIKYSDFFNDGVIVNENFPHFGGGANSATLSSQPIGGNSQPDDPNLTINAWDKHKNNIRDQFQRLEDIMRSVFGTGEFGMNGIGDIFDNITDLSIVRIFPNNQNSLDIYMKFRFDEEDYYASFKNWASNNTKETFKTRLFIDNPRISNFDNIVKIEGIFKKTLNWWFIPKELDYVALQDVKVYDDMGDISYITSGSNIEVIETITENDKPYIHIKFEKKSFYINNHDYYYFNWWFKLNEQIKYYL